MKNNFTALLLALIATTSSLTIFGASAQQELPFAYHSPTAEEREKSVFIPEGFYAIISKKTAIQSVIVGPTCPNFMVAAYDADQDKTIVIHAKIHTDPKKLAVIIANYGGTNIDRLTLYSRDSETHIKECNPDYTKEEVKEVAKRSSVSSFTQNINFSNARNELEKMFDLDPSQVTAIYNTTTTPASLNTHRLALSSLFITREFKISSVCQISERIFAPEAATPMPLTFDSETLLKNFNDRETVRKTFINRYTIHGQQQPYLRIPDTEVGLEKLATLLGRS